jgi:SAM-dependent methyltransferase
MLLKVLNLLAPQMRAPGAGIGGWVAMKIMETGNPPSIIAGIDRLDIQKDDVVVELGAGHGVGMRQVFQKQPKRYIGVEISESFRDKLHLVKQQLEEGDTCTTLIDIYGNDAKDMSFLENGAVDKMFAMNVVYFLDPLSVYLTEIHRVLKPNATVVFGCKFGAVKDAPPPFVNTREEDIIKAMDDTGFDVSFTKVELEKPMYSFTEIKGVKK